MHDVGAVAVGERAHRLDRVAVADALTVCVAPNSSADSSFAVVEVDRDHRAPRPPAARRRSRRRRRRRSRTPRRCRRAGRSPVSIAAPSPAITPQPSRPGRLRVARPGSTFVAWPAATSVFSAKAPMPSAGRARCRRRASSSGSRCGWRSSTRAGPRRHARHSPHTARQLRITKSPGATSVTSVADRLDDARGLVAEQEREVVVDRALAVVQVGVAHAARLHAAPAPRRVPGRGRRSSPS